MTHWITIEKLQLGQEVLMGEGAWQEWVTVTCLTYHLGMEGELFVKMSVRGKTEHGELPDYVLPAFPAQYRIQCRPVRGDEVVTTEEQSQSHNFQER